MSKTNQEALRLLDLACNKKLNCKVGSAVYRFSAYDVRGSQVFIDILDKTNQVKSITRDLDLLAAFMERAIAGELTQKADKIIQLADLEAYTVTRGSKKTVVKNTAKVWKANGGPSKIVFSAEFSLEVKRLNPSLKVKIYFMGTDIVFISNPDKGSRVFTNTAPGRLGIRCEKFASKVKFNTYTCITQDIDNKISFILTGIK